MRYNEMDWVYHGTTLEDAAAVESRMPLVLPTFGRRHWVSCEPLLGPIDLGRWIRGLAWVVVGCESGPGKRPMDLEWVRALRDQSVNAGVPFYFKQKMDGNLLIERPELDGRQWLETPCNQGGEDRV